MSKGAVVSEHVAGTIVPPGSVRNETPASMCGSSCPRVVLLGLVDQYAEFCPTSLQDIVASLFSCSYGALFAYTLQRV